MEPIGAGSHGYWQSMLLLSHFSRVRLCATPWTAAYQASLSMGFSRQEHWSGLPFPSPMRESGKWNSRQLMPDTDGTIPSLSPSLAVSLQCPFGQSPTLTAGKAHICGIPTHPSITKKSLELRNNGLITCVLHHTEWQQFYWVIFFWWIYL